MLILGVTGLYVVAGGFHGIVRVEIVQTIVLSAGAIGFAIIGYRHFDAGVFAAHVSGNWMSISPQVRPSALQGVVAGGTDYSFFGALVAVWVAKGLLLCFSGPEQLYDFQRFLRRAIVVMLPSWAPCGVRFTQALAVRNGNCGHGDHGIRQRSLTSAQARPGDSASVIIGTMLRWAWSDSCWRIAVWILGNLQFDG